MEPRFLQLPSLQAVSLQERLSQLFFDPLTVPEPELDFRLLDGVSLGRSLAAVSPYVSLLFAIVAPYFTACASLLYTLIRVISLTIGFH